MNSEILVAPVVCSMVAYFAYIILKWRQSKYRLNVQLKMIEKVRSAEELISFAGTDAGNKFLNSFATEPETPTNTKAKILSGINKGMILTILGIAILAVKSIATDIESRAAITIFGTIFASIGVGYLIATGFAYSLAKKWGAIKLEENSEEKEI